MTVILKDIGADAARTLITVIGEELQMGIRWTHLPRPHHIIAQNCLCVFTLRPFLRGMCIFQARNTRGVHMNSINWIGHKAFMERLYEAQPDAYVLTYMARYTSQEDFLAKVKEVEDQ